MPRLKIPETATAGYSALYLARDNKLAAPPRFKELKNRAPAESAKTRIMETPGITNVEITTVTGSILMM